MIIRYINFLKLLKRLFFDKDMHTNYKNFTPPPKKKSIHLAKKILCRFADNYFFFLFPNASYSFTLKNFIKASIIHTSSSRRLRGTSRWICRRLWHSWRFLSSARYACRIGYIFFFKTATKTRFQCVRQIIMR